MDLATLREQVEAAATAGDCAAIATLVDRLGAAVVRLDAQPDELTTLHYAAGGGNAGLVAYLLSDAVGADSRAARKNAFTPLHAAAMNGHTEACGLLLDAGADINAQTQPQGYAPLHSAAFAGHVETIKLLLRRGANPQLRNYRGETPAATARRTGQQEAVRLLDDDSGV